VGTFREIGQDTYPFANLPEKRRTIWALTREEMKNCAEARRADRVRRMDARPALDALKFVRDVGGQGGTGRAAISQ
jgi:hypothetical protein